MPNADIIKIDLFWSEEDQEYVARLTDQHGVSALGSTVKEALEEFAQVLPTIVEMQGFETVATHQG